ncbi:MAG: hypothetical protein K6E40_10090 [Desulfovibrio sp.]|nr:hypothetical protein [Desulfovibrio sp.]
MLLCLQTLASKASNKRWNIVTPCAGMPASRDGRERPAPAGDACPKAMHTS